MLFLLVTIIPLLILLSKSLPLQPLPGWASEERLLSASFWQDLLCSGISTNMGPKKKCCPRAASAAGRSPEMSVLDLPDLALELIMVKLPPSALRGMAGVCSSMRDLCRSDHLWERHMMDKWGRVVGPAARREWDWCLATRRDRSAGCADRGRKRKRWLGSLSCVWPLSWLKSRLDSGGAPASPVLDDSVMSWYLSLESGKFWFPAQVYNRENGHVGFMLSCYDAEVSYDRRTDTFQAKFPPHGRRAAVVEEGVGWDRIRAPPVDTPAHDLHVTDCLNDLRPSDHIEIQWRRNKEFPYGWWYGIVGHSEPCDGSEHFCRCHLNDTVVLEFNHYAPGSRWRRTTISRKDHREEGNETVGFYGGVRKLSSKDEISTWKQLWPVEVFE